MTGAIGLVALDRDLGFKALHEAGIATVRTSIMLARVTSGGAFLSVAFNDLGSPTQVVGRANGAVRPARSCPISSCCSCRLRGSS